MKKNHDIVTLDIKIKHQTEKAVMVENLKGQKVWLPKSQIEVDHENLTIDLPEWLAEETGLI